MLKAIALDDEPPALSVLENFCARTDFIRLEKTFTRPKEALLYLRKSPIDLLFLDIQMPSISGINFYKSIDQKTGVIFTTAYSEYAVEGFNLDATDYLLKPFTFERFLQAINKARTRVEQFGTPEPSSPAYLFVRSNYSLVKIAIEEILFIESQDDYLKIHLPGAEPVVTRMTMKTVLKKLPPEKFVRVHRSFIVAVEHVEQLRNRVILIAGTMIPVSPNYYERFMRQFRQS